MLYVVLSKEHLRIKQISNFEDNGKKVLVFLKNRKEKRKGIQYYEN
jgi:hypothetical protein